MQWVGGAAQWRCPHCDHGLTDDGGLWAYRIIPDRGTGRVIYEALTENAFYVLDMTFNQGFQLADDMDEACEHGQSYESGLRRWAAMLTKPVR
jgi:hypothetical protein